MNPEQVDIVVGTWRAAGDNPYRLRVAISDRLPGTPVERGRRISWIVDAVTGLTPIISRPSSFSDAAAELIRRRRPVSMDELGVDQAALLGALDEIVGPLTVDERRAWDLALKLFEETIASLCLDPFHTGGVGVDEPVAS